MRKLAYLLFILLSIKTSAQIYSPNGNNSFVYNGAADVILKYPERGSGGRAMVHGDYNTLVFNFESDFSGGTRIGNDVFFKDGGNSFIYSGNFGIGTNQPDTPLTVYGVSTFFPRRINGGDARSLSINYSFNNPQFENNIYPVFLRTGGGNQPLILDAARVGIGTANPSAMFTVAGDIHSREVKVTVDAGADFVFEKNYNLPSLESVDKFIKENKHLPEIASAEEMKKNGINLSEMNIKLLQKIEELTLYVIQQERKNDDQSKKIEELERENKDLKLLSERILKLEKQSK